jgi:phage shock protein PspC (stress-responsive transcriptional regulator)
MVYVSGMIAGFILLAPLAALGGLLISIFGELHLHTLGTQAFFACIAAGGLGAVVSVLSRMASPKKFDIDPEVGRQALVFLGIFRPLVGAVFGLALYFLLQSSVLQVSSDNKFATYVVAAFLGGFSERFVKVMLHSAEGSLDGDKSGEAQPDA